MGNCLASEESKKDKAIQKNMRADNIRQRNKVKILLLGAGESGKSTLFKQMKLLYSQNKNFTDSERTSFVSIIHGNITFDAKVMIQSTESHSPLQSPQAREIAGEVMKWEKDRQVGPQEAEMLKVIWKDKGMRNTWLNRGDIQVQDAFEYYMDEIDRIATTSWLPNNQDILRSRARTSGVVSESFRIARTMFDMYDVGGQRNERRKWIHQFAGVTTVLFVAAISEYNQKLYEDQHVSRQDEAVQLFKQQVELPTFLNTPFILFLNKTDLFREKLGVIPFRVDAGRDRRNVDFQGPHCDTKKTYNWRNVGADAAFEKCYSAAIEYLSDLYQKQSPPQRGEPNIYVHPTNSTDSDNIDKIMHTCKEIILNNSLIGEGFLDG